MKKTFERIVNYLKKNFPGVQSITLVPHKSASWKTFKFGMEITTETRSSKLADENVKWGVVFESGYYALQPLAAWITRTSVKVGKIRLLLLVLPRVQERSSEQALNWSLAGERWYEIVSSLTEMTRPQLIAWFVLLTVIRWIAIYPVDSVIQSLNNWGQNATKQASVTTLHVSVVWVLYKNNASNHKQRQLNCCFLSLFYFLLKV